MHGTAFIGHRDIFDYTLPKRIQHAIETAIQNGCRFFTMGTHGEFDRLALSTCKALRKIYPDIEIEVVITSLNFLNRYRAESAYIYSDIKTVMYDIENLHYKQRITASNRQMIDRCDTLIAYANDNVYRSGAKSAMEYAKKKGLNVLNLYTQSSL